MNDDSEQLTLREIAQRAIDRNGGRGGRALGRAAAAQGLTLSYTTVDKILAGTYTSRPSRNTLEALSRLSGVPLADVHEAAGEPLPQAPLARQLPPDADLLTPDQRRVVVDVVRQFAKQNRDLDEARREREEGEHGGDTAAIARPLRAVARRDDPDSSGSDET